MCISEGVGKRILVMAARLIKLTCSIELKHATFVKQIQIIRNIKLIKTKIN